MKQEQQFKEALRAAGERVTTPRLSIFRILARHAPLSTSKLLSRATEQGVDTVTTYRTIGLFRRLSLVQEMGLGRHRLLELSDNDHGHHHHFICASCGKITDFDSAVIEEALHKIEANLKFELHSHQLEATGTCSECQISNVEISKI